MNDLSEGLRGITNMCFFPIDNTKGKADRTLTFMINKLEQKIKNSFYFQQSIPLIWLQILDKIDKHKESNSSYLSFNEVANISIECGIRDEDEIREMLLFLSDMGYLLWINESNLRDTIILDAVEYLVKPATNVICKHILREDDGDETIHQTEWQEKCMQKFPFDYTKMTETGLVTNQLMEELLGLANVSRTSNVKQLMVRYGSLVSINC
jgi:hypothetical protein